MVVKITWRLISCVECALNPSSLSFFSVNYLPPIASLNTQFKTPAKATFFFTMMIKRSVNNIYNNLPDYSNWNIIVLSNLSCPKLSSWSSRHTLPSVLPISFHKIENQGQWSICPSFLPTTTTQLAILADSTP